jgi:hypothetical protein
MDCVPTPPTAGNPKLLTSRSKDRLLGALFGVVVGVFSPWQVRSICADEIPAVVVLVA